MSTLSVVLLHDKMVDKHHRLVTTSLTLIDVHDLARSSRTYGVDTLYIAHPAPLLRKLTQRLAEHWAEGFGAVYNPNRKEALDCVRVVDDLEGAVADMDLRFGKLPTLVATSAKAGGSRMSFAELRSRLADSHENFLLMLGTGWGMSQELLDRADLFLDPILGPTPYNHLSVRSACAIMLDRLLGLP